MAVSIERPLPRLTHAAAVLPWADRFVSELWARLYDIIHSVNAGIVTRRSVAATYTAQANDCYIGVDVSGGVVTINLPPAASVGGGKFYHVKDEYNGVTGAGTNNITIDGNGSEEIDGSTTYVISTDLGSVSIVCDGTAWWSV
jgi:hypothetical protein